MKPTVYIETTIPSYYCDRRQEIAADIARTREWWDRERSEYKCFISPVVLDELSEGDYPNKDACLRLIQGVALLAVTADVLQIADIYQSRKLMPRLPVRDVLHVALASYYRMSYLLTWNCRHIANVNKMRHLQVLNSELGLNVPLLVTPALLRPMEEEL
jgi:predicted nucleic acid-binding protein